MVGPRGCGKSNFSLWSATQLTDEENIYIVHTAREFLLALRDCPKYSVIVYDEGLRGLMGRQAMSVENKEQIKAFAQMRQNKNLIVFIVTQDLQMLERHVRTIACDGLFRCTFKEDASGCPEQGLVMGYGPKKILEIKADQQGNIKWPSPDWWDTFPSIAETEIWMQYVDMEGKQKQQSTLDGIKTIDSKHKKPKSNAQLKKEVGIEMKMADLQKKGKTIRQIQRIILRQDKKHMAVSTIFNKLKKLGR